MIRKEQQLEQTIGLVFESTVQIVKEILDGRLNVCLNDGMRTAVAIWWISQLVFCGFGDGIDISIIVIVIFRGKVWKMPEWPRLLW